LKFDQVVNPPRRLTHQADLAAPEAVTRLRQSTRSGPSVAGAPQQRITGLLCIPLPADA
jgi:hypothetical protein